VLPISEKLLLDVEPLSDARTPLADFFSILLNVADGRGRKQSLNQADKSIVLSV
jgi:hypothetical protein